MKLRQLFKVRQPGNGNAFQKKVENLGTISIQDKGKRVPNGGDKKSV